jgi:hypothetical protein
MLKRSLSAIALAAALTAPAFAQTPPDKSIAPTLSAPAGGAFVQDQRATDWRGTKLVGTIVYGPDNASIGDVKDVIIGNDSKVRAVVIGVGGFLGVGEKNVAVPLDSLNITRKPESESIEKITVGYSKDELKQAPGFTYFDPAKLQTTGSGTKLNGLK